MLLPNDDATVPSTSEPDTSCSNTDNEGPDKPTGFALYNSYKTEVTFDDNAPNYIFVDGNKLSNFMEKFPCPECAGNLQVLQMPSKGTDGFQAWFERHNPNCQKNFDGSSPSMETEAAERIWKRSEEH
ncbi:hypothetical protein J6590_092891 [Homalodisca vitripennis]|nr:hypothetical protein J6590_092891 [Homalodisca vitripennis]